MSGTPLTVGDRPVDLQAHLPAKGVHSLETALSVLSPRAFADAEEIAEVRGLAVPVLALQNGCLEGGIVAHDLAPDNLAKLRIVGLLD